MSNTDMHVSKFSVRSLGATANLIKNTQKIFFQTVERMQVGHDFQSK